MHGSQLAFQDRNLKRNNRRQSRQPCMVLAPSKEEGQRLREVKWLNTKYTSISKSRLIFIRRKLGRRFTERKKIAIHILCSSHR